MPPATASAVWCLVAAAVATGSPGAGPVAAWARTLARLTGHARCAGCETTWAVADLVAAPAEAVPVAAGDGVLAGQTALLPLDVRPRTLLPAGDVLLIGHDEGLVAMELIAGR